MISVKKCDKNTLDIEFQLNRTAQESHTNISLVFGYVLSLSRCYYWFGRVKSGNFDLKDQSRCGQPEEVDNDVLEDLITADPRLSIVELSAILGFHQTIICDHLNAIGKVFKAGIWVPHQLLPENLLQRATICTSLFSRQKG